MTLGGLCFHGGPAEEQNQRTQLLAPSSSDGLPVEGQRWFHPPVQRVGWATSAA